MHHREWGAPGQARSPPADRFDHGKPSWEAGGQARILGPEPELSPVARGELRARPVQSPPLQKEEPGSLLHTPALRATKKPRLRRRSRTLGWWGRGLNPAGFPPGNSEQGSSPRVLERVRYHLAPFRCTSGCACLPSSRISGDQGGSMPSRGILSSLRIRTVAAPRGRRCNPRHQ